MAKRKEMEEAIEGLSYPDAKIRRLDQMLPPTIEKLAFNTLPMEQQLSSKLIGGNDGRPAIELMMDESEILPPLASSSSEDRAIVLYNPSVPILNFIQLQPNSSIVVSPELVHGLKNQVFHQGNNQSLEDKSLVRNDSLAVVPWVPPPLLATTIATNWPISQMQRHNEAMIEQAPMESEEDTSMEIETEPVETQETSIYGVNGSHEGFYQHCLAPGAPPNSTSPAMWSQ